MRHSKLDRLAEAYNRARAHEKAGDFDAAANTYREALTIGPGGAVDGDEQRGCARR